MEVNLWDAWQMRNPNTRDSTFFLSDIKLIHVFVSPGIFQFVLDTDILPILISDHDPMLYSFNLVPKSSCANRWQFNTYLLQNEDILKQLHSGLIESIQLNYNSTDNPQIVKR